MTRRLGSAIVVGLVASVALLLNTASRRASADITDLPRRHWEDTSMALGRYVGQKDAERLDLRSWDGSQLNARMRRRLIAATQRAGIRPWEFYRVIKAVAYPVDRVVAPRPSDDTGRSILATLGFRLAGGISPFMVTWVGALFTVPLFVWVAAELAWSGRLRAGALFLILTATSAYFVDVLSLSYSAAGFSTASLLVVVALAAYAFLHPTPDANGLLVRAALGGLFWAVCVLSRSGAALTVIGLIVAVLAASTRLAIPTSRRAATGAAAVVLLLAPFAVMRPPSRHEAWLGIWEGLGDFDRTKGHTFNDPVARMVLSDAGIVIPRSLPVWSRAAETEAFFRERVLASVKQDPAWFAAILAKRAFATLTQSKLLPSRSETGRSFAPRTHPQEGHIDVYYSLTATGDIFALGRREWEAPMWLLWLPLLALMAGAVGFVPAWRAELGVVGIVGSAALAQPVLVTTAGALEPQAFCIVYFFAAAFLGSRLIGGIPPFLRRHASSFHGGAN